MALSPRDRAAVLKLLEQAQLAYGLTLLPKKRVLDDPADVDRLRERLAAIREVAEGLSKELRDGTKVPWLLLMDDSEEPDKVWTTAKKAIPKLVKELTPLVSDAPEAAFFSGIQPAREKVRSGNGKPAVKPALRVVKKTMRLTFALSCPRCGRLIEQRSEIDAPMTAARAAKDVASAGAAAARELADELAEHLRSKHAREEEEG